MRKRPVQERAILNMKEAADYLRCSERTLRQWISDGRVIPARLGKRRSVVFQRSELDRFVEEAIQRPQAA